jgi:DUF971 family protein
MPIAPTKLQLKRDEKLTIHWTDGQISELTIRQLRRACPCASCKELKAQQAKTRLVVMQASTGPIEVAEAKLVGNYALNITWSDGHAAGIYSFDYLRNLTRDAEAKAST